MPFDKSRCLISANIYYWKCRSQMSDLRIEFLLTYVKAKVFSGKARGGA